MIINFLKDKTAESKIRNIILYPNFNEMIVIQLPWGNQKLQNNQVLKTSRKGNQKFHTISKV